MAKLEDVEAAVAANTTAIQAAIALIASLKQQGVDPARLQAMVDKLAADDAALGAA